MIKSLANLAADILYKRSLRLQAGIGYELILNNIPDGWINGIVLMDMTSTWRKAGIEARGLNYFTVGAIKDGLSSRYDPASPYYQAWFGGYIVRFDQERDWTPQEHVLLGIADQEKWLRYYGDPNPAMKFTTDNQGETVTLGKYKTKIYFWSGITHSDVGDKSNWLLKPTMQAMANIMNKSNPNWSSTEATLYQNGLLV